jgi:hypothetical protein
MRAVFVFIFGHRDRKDAPPTRGDRAVFNFLKALHHCNNTDALECLIPPLHQA